MNRRRLRAGSIDPPRANRAMLDPRVLPRALRHLGASGFDAEADTGLSLCRASNRDEALVEATGLVSFLHARDRLEYHVKTGNAARVGWMLRWGGADVKVYAPRSAWAPARWKLPLCEAPPVEGEAWFEARRADWPVRC